MDLLNQAWLSWRPDVTLLNPVMKLEALLGEPDRPGVKSSAGRIETRPQPGAYARGLAQ
jgi:hypothetical protein